MNVIRSTGSIVSVTRTITSAGLTKTVRIATAPRFSSAPITVVRNRVLPGSSALPVWGGIAGALSSQTDLQAALDAKAAASHAHVISDVTGLQTALDNTASSTAVTAAIAAHVALSDPHPTYLTAAEGAALPFAPVAHAHSQADVTGLVTALAGKEATGVAAAADAAHLAAGDPHPQYLTPAEGNAAYSALGHSHAQADVTGLVAALAGKAATAHSHIIADTTGLQAALDAKLDDNQATAFGLSLLDDADAAAGRTTLGLGTAAASNTSDFAAAAHTHPATQISDSTAAGRSMLTAADVAAQTALLNNFTALLKGLTPASNGGAVNFLRADGTWAAPSGGGGGANTVRQAVDFGASFTDKAQAVVTGQAWVTVNSNIVPQVLTPSGADPDEMYLLKFQPVVSNLVAGTGFTLTLYSEPEARGVYDVMCLAA